MMKHLAKKTALVAAVAAASASVSYAGNDYGWNKYFGGSHFKQPYFERVATFPVFENLAAGESADDETAAEISAISKDGNFVFYSDSPKGRIGIIDITNPKAPAPAGFIALDGEPTSVAVRGNLLLVAINTSASFTDPSGALVVYNISNPKAATFVKSFDMGGQPDSIDVSPDGKYAAVVIENERDEDLNDGIIPQLPAGLLQVVKMRGKVDNWKVRSVDLTGYADIAPSDPEPEYVSINRGNIAAVTLQENNHIILVDLRRARVINDFSAGTADLFNVDTNENDLIEPVDTILDRKREPDAITWLNNFWLVTANEGDYEDENGEEGGSRGFTIFTPWGTERYESGSTLEHKVLRAGHYPEDRSENKGIEPEAVTAARYGYNNFLFVGAERANVVAVYSVGLFGQPMFHQLLPTTVGPEGVLAVPSRNLLIVSSEKDDADDGFRSTVSIYQLGADSATYPEIKSDDSQLIPWGALSGLVADNADADKLYAVPDSFYKQSRIYDVDVSATPAVITGSTVLMKDGATVDYDLEGIAQREDGSFWLVSEGKVGSTNNLLILADAEGTVQKEVTLPAAVMAAQKKHGFEGVAVVGSGADEKVLVAFQRAWATDPAEYARIGVYSPATESWAFAYYPLDAAQEGAWVGLSEITAIDDETFAIIERDNQQGDKAQIKRMYKFSLAGVAPVAEGGSIPVLSKTLVKDLLPELKATGGWVVDKAEGSAIAADGSVYVVTDNDGIDDATGETRFMSLGKLFK